MSFFSHIKYRNLRSSINIHCIKRYNFTTTMHNPYATLHNLFSGFWSAHNSYWPLLWITTYRDRTSTPTNADIIAKGRWNIKPLRNAKWQKAIRPLSQKTTISRESPPCNNAVFQIAESSFRDDDLLFALGIDTWKKLTTKLTDRISLRWRKPGAYCNLLNAILPLTSAHWILTYMPACLLTVRFLNR